MCICQKSIKLLDMVHLIRNSKRNWMVPRILARLAVYTGIRLSVFPGEAWVYRKGKEYFYRDYQVDLAFPFVRLFLVGTSTFHCYNWQKLLCPIYSGDLEWKFMILKYISGSRKSFRS